MDSDQAHPPDGGGGSGGEREGGSGVFSQPFQNQPVAARVPEKNARGVFTTGVLVQDGPYEFVLDFLQALTQPRQIAARVVLSPGVMNALVGTLQDNLNKYIQTYGPPAPLPRPPQPQRRPTIQEIYENFKLPEDLWSGVYANSVLIGHAPSEFFMDFITGFYPTAAVSARIYMAAQQMPRVLETLRMSMAQYQKRISGQQQAQPPQAPPGGPATTHTD
ncbi:MAG TPA: DUF3467 domain-containing protein [Tepidisphaeraceae bacterium]|jgi:hypothetical protein|nr:DUF3467 domain-containing protein [Tepidisphaeraceae bacterium]